MNPFETTRCRFALIGLTLVTALVPSLFAADITWADSAGNTTWTSNSTINSAPASASWVGGVAPMNNIATDTAIFTSVSNAQPALTVQTRIAGVDFRMAAGGLAMSGGGGNGSLFQVGAGGVDSSLQTSGTNTITNARIVINGASGIWNIFSSDNTTSTSTFTFNSTVDLANNLTVIGQRDGAAGNVGIINFSRAITNNGTLTINSANTNNTVNLTGNNTYLGVTTVTAGIVNVQNNQSAANGGWSIVTSANSTATQSATVNFSTGSTVVVDAAKKIQIGTTANSGTYAASTLNVAGTVTNNGTLQLERAGVLNLNSGAIWTQSGNLAVSGRGGASSTLNVNAGSDMTYSGSSTVKLNSAGASAGTGGLNIDGTGRFTTSAGFENLTTLTTGSGVSRVRLTNGGTLRLSADVANLTTQTRFDLSTGGGVIDTNGFSTALSGVTSVGSTSTAAGITGNGTLTKTGNGTLILSGNNTYTGNTTVFSGTLELSGSQASPLTVNAGAGLRFTLNDGLSPVATSTSSLALSANSTVSVVGTPVPGTTYTLYSASAVTGTPVLTAPIAGYDLVVESNSLKLKPTAGGDTTPPAAPTVSLPAASDTGSSGSDLITKLTTPTLRVTLNGTGPAAPRAGDVVKLFNGATEVASAVLSAGDISATFVDLTTGVLAPGSLSFTATVTDTATVPNVSDPSTALPVILDTAAPVISVTSPSSSSVAWGGTYTDAGATASDDTAPFTAAVVTTNPVNTAKPGIYSVAYNATDIAGNIATPVIRTVTVSIANPTTVGADGLSPLLRYALGANSPSETVQAPVLNSTATTLSLTAVVRTDDTALTVGAEAVDNLTGTWGTGGTVTATDAADQSGVPSGSARKVFTVDTTGASRKFLRLTATLTP